MNGEGRPADGPRSLHSATLAGASGENETPSRYSTVQERRVRVVVEIEPEELIVARLICDDFGDELRMLVDLDARSERLLFEIRAALENLRLELRARAARAVPGDLMGRAA